MAGVIKKYILGKNRLTRSLLDGFSLADNGTLNSSDEEDSVRHVFLRGLDGVDDDLNWGRLSLKAKLDGDLLFVIRAVATNDPIFIRKGEITKIDDFLLDPSIAPAIKEQFFGAAGGIEITGVQDALLYDLKGRYLYLWIEVTGIGTASISDLTLYVPGDNFYATFPAVYQTEDNFFQRYLSIFSTIYNDFQETIDHLDSFLDIDTAPVSTLHLFASWLGLETKGLLTDVDALRRLLKAAPGLFCLKGTKTAIEGVISLFVSDPFYVIEQNLLTQQQLNHDMYGSTPYDFTILINCKADEQLRTSLEFFINQFKPIRSQYQIIFLGGNSGLDSFTYLDFNGTVLHSAPGRLDGEMGLTGTTYLK